MFDDFFWDGKPDLVHFRGQPRQGLTASCQQLHLGDILIITHIEGHSDDGVSVIGADGGHVDHAGQYDHTDGPGQDHDQRDAHGKNGSVNEEVHNNTPF